MLDIFLFCFQCQKIAFLKQTKKMCFIIFQRLFSFLRYSNLRTLESKASRSPQMLKYKTRNAFNWIIWVGNTSGNNIWPVYVILQEKNFHQNIQQKCWTSNTQSSTYLYLNEEPYNYWSNIFYWFNMQFPLISPLLEHYPLSN